MRATEFIAEKWSQKYKRSIDCSHPKGFSQRAHCQGRKKTDEEQLDELQFLGSTCTKDCSGHRAGYAWSQSKGGRVAQSPFSPSFNKGSQLYVDGK